MRALDAKKTGMALAFFLFGSSSVYAALHAVGYKTEDYTSDFMAGKAVVGILFPESDGTTDPQTETWDEARKQQAVSEIMEGLDWWTKQNPKVPLSFTYVTQTIATGYEPITRSGLDTPWISETVGKLGYSGSQFSACTDYVNDLRKQHGTDWGFLIFVVDSLNDTNGKFADGYFAYAYLGGPFLVMTYDNNGYGISNMSYVAAHETGHIFHALDQYAGASSPSEYSYGYFPTINGNHVFSPDANDSSSIMRGGLRDGLDSWSKDQIGWKDSNKDGIPDLIGQPVSVNLSPQAISSGAGSPKFVGEATLAIVARQANTQGYGLTLDSIANVEYRFKGNDWSAATATDGGFDNTREPFSIPLPVSAQGGAPSVNAQEVEVRARTYFDLLTAASETGTRRVAAPPLSLDKAHAFPNPFKPYSNLGHTGITFTELTLGAKVQIFTVAGEPVFSATSAPPATTLDWAAVDDQGKAVASGVYYYLITDSNGNKKKGKVAVVR